MANNDKLCPWLFGYCRLNNPQCRLAVACTSETMEGCGMIGKEEKPEATITVVPTITKRGSDA